MRKVFLETIPTRGAGNQFNWKKSVGCSVRFIYNNHEGTVEIVDYIVEKEILVIKYENKTYQIAQQNFRKCQLGILLEERTGNFKFEIGYMNNNIVITDRKIEKTVKLNGKEENVKKYKYRCLDCGFNGEEHYINGQKKKEYWTYESSLIRGVSCACCKAPRNVIVTGINDVNTIQKDIVKFFKNKEEAKIYPKSSKHKIDTICPDCGAEKPNKTSIASISKNRSIGCTCSDGFSYGHKIVFSVLKQLGVSFSDNKRFEWCCYPAYGNKNKIKKGEYDFYLIDMNILIEVDGEWHREDNRLKGTPKEKAFYDDNQKDILANRNGFKIIRVSDEYDFIENLKRSELSEILNLEKVDWKECCEFALKNRAKEICIYWEQHKENISIKDIACKFMIDRNTVRRYLKIGNNVGWCSYIKENAYELRKKVIQNKKGN